MVQFVHDMVPDLESTTIQNLCFFILWFYSFNIPLVSMIKNLYNFIHNIDSVQGYFKVPNLQFFLRSSSFILVTLNLKWRRGREGPFPPLTLKFEQIFMGKCSSFLTLKRRDIGKKKKFLLRIYQTIPTPSGLFMWVCTILCW